MTPVTVVVVEDSPTQRAMIVRAIEEDRGGRVVAEAVSCAQAVDAVAQWRPEVVTLDLEIPGGRDGTPGAGGLEAVRGIMARTPTPILVLSAHADGSGSGPAMRALAAGATDALPKPRTWTQAERDDLRRRLRTLRGVAVVGRRGAIDDTHSRPLPSGSGAPLDRDAASPSARRPIVGLVASTGGPPALRRVITDLRGLEAPIVVVQHLHPEFCDGFARWLQECSGMPVHVLRRPEHPRPGEAYLAPGGHHVRLHADGLLALHVRPETLHRPSGDELLWSLAEHAGPVAVGAVLTGMGDDGAAGLLALAERGGVCLAQDRASCAVYGMPRAAVEIGAAASTTPLSAIGPSIRQAVAAARRPR